MEKSFSLLIVITLELETVIASESYHIGLVGDVFSTDCYSSGNIGTVIACDIYHSEKMPVTTMYNAVMF